MEWADWVYAPGFLRPQPLDAARWLSDHPEITTAQPHLALATGVVDASILHHPNSPGGPFAMPPLAAVTFSTLVRLPEYTDPLLEAARQLLAAGAGVNSSWTDPAFPHSPLSALYGAAGKNRNPDMTRLLLAAGANPNDNESLYHSLADADFVCTRLLLKAKAVVAGTNALCRALDFDNLAMLEFLLAHTTDPNEGQPLFSAIRRRRSPAHVRALLLAGADPSGMHVAALRYGLPHLAALLPDPGPLTPADQFVAACALAHRGRAQQLLDAHPGLISRLDGDQLRVLPELAFSGCADAVRCMVELGWPVAVRGGDWDATVLNAAVFSGDPDLTRFLLEHGASWREEHGYGDNVAGTLEFASQAQPVEGGDWDACAEILRSHGMPVR